MQDNSLFFCKNNIFHYPTLTSTNKKALLMVESGITTPFVITTNYQTKGKGRNQNKWISEKGKNLLCSIVLFPTFLGTNKQFTLLQIISLSVLFTLLSRIKNVFIKWPNDIYVKKKKICGILIESAIQGKSINYAICGIGLNVQQLNFEGVDIPATSLLEITNKHFKIKELLEELLQYIENFYNEFLLAKNYEKLHEIYTKHLYLYRKFSAFQTGTEFFSGKIIGVDSVGRLGIEKEGKRVQYFEMDEIDFIDKID